MQHGACGCTCGAGSKVPADELDAPLLVLDLERGCGQDHTVAPTMTAAAMTEAVRAALLLDAQEVEVGKAVWKAIKCVFPTPDLIDAEQRESHRSISTSEEKGFIHLDIVIDFPSF